MRRSSVLALFIAIGALLATDIHAQTQPLSAAALEHLDRARAAMDRNQYDEAIGEFRRVLKTDPACLDCYFQLIAAYQRVGAHKDALDAARKALAIAPNDYLRATAHQVIGVETSSLADSRKMRHEDAEREFRIALQLNPDDPNIYFNLGVELMKEGRDPDGAAALNEYLKRTPQGSHAKSARALIENPRRARERFAPADFAVVTRDGEYLTLDDLKGKIVLLDFWASWCKPCESAVPALQHLAKRYAREQFMLISISVDQNEQAWQKFIAAHRMNWPQAIDHDYKLRRMFDVQPIPTYVLIDSEGIMRSYVIGAGFDSASQLESEIKNNLKSAKVQNLLADEAAPASSAAKATPAAGETATAAGTVRGELRWNDQPAAGVQVVITGPNGYLSPTPRYGPATTDAQGRFSLGGIPDGIYQVHVPGWGYPIREFEIGATSKSALVPATELVKSFSPLSPGNGAWLSNGRPLLQWEPYPGASEYAIRVSRRVDHGRFTTVIDPESHNHIATASAAIDSDLPPGDYAWQVDAFNAAGHLIARSDFSQSRFTIASAATTPEAPRKNAATAPNASAPNVESLAITSEPAGAQIYLDHDFVGNAPATLKVQPGRHTIRLGLRGYHSWTNELSAQPGAEARVDAVLVRNIPGTVHGRVLWNERPVAGVTVSLRECSTSSPRYGPATSDERGAFTIAGVPDGRMCLDARPTNPQQYWAAEVPIVEVAPAGESTLPDAHICKVFDPVSPRPGMTVNESRPMLRWDAFPEAVGYAVQVWRISPDRRYVAMYRRGDRDPHIDGTGVQVESDLAPGEYFWRVDAYNGAGHVIGCNYPIRFTVSASPGATSASRNPATPPSRP